MYFSSSARRAMEYSEKYKDKQYMGYALQWLIIPLEKQT